MGKRRVKPGGARPQARPRGAGWRIARAEASQAGSPGDGISMTYVHSPSGGWGEGWVAALPTSMVTDSRPDRAMTVAKDW